MKKTVFLLLILTFTAMPISALDSPREATTRSTVSNGVIPNIFSPVGRWIRKLLGIKPKPVEEGGPADVTKLTLSTTKIVVSCDPEAAGKRQLIEVWTEAYDREKDVLTYVYNPSAGKIIGEGPNVMWDLTGVETGTYTLAAGVNDGCGVCGYTKITTIEIVRDTPCGTGKK